MKLKYFVVIILIVSATVYSCDPSRIHQWQITKMLSEKAFSEDSAKDTIVKITNDILNSIQDEVDINANQTNTHIICGSETDCSHTDEPKEPIAVFGIAGLKDRFNTSGVVIDGLDLTHKNSTSYNEDNFERLLGEWLEYSGYKLVKNKEINEFLKKNNLTEADLIFPEKSKILKKEFGIDYLLYFQLIDYQRSYAWTVETLPTIFRIFGKITQDTMSVRGKVVNATNGYIKWIDEIRGLSTLVTAYRSETNDINKAKLIEYIKEYKNAQALNTEFVSDELLKELEKFQDLSEENMEFIQKRYSEEQMRLEKLLLGTE